MDRKEYNKMYAKSENGKKAIAKYHASEKGKAAHKRYSQTEKGKLNLKKQTEKYHQVSANSANKSKRYTREEIDLILDTDNSIAWLVEKLDRSFKGIEGSRRYYRKNRG